MTRYVAFLRAINVGGAHVVKMDALRRQFEQLGFTDVETFIASGNVIFTSRSGGAAALERRIERQLEKALGYEVRVFLRTDAEVAAIAAHKPFTDQRRKSAGAFCVGFLAAPLAPGAAKTVLALRNAIDDFHVNGREVYWLCTKRQSESTFSNALLEKMLKTPSTFRGFNTVQKLSAKYPP